MIELEIDMIYHVKHNHPQLFKQHGVDDLCLFYNNFRLSFDSDEPEAFIEWLSIIPENIHEIGNYV